MVEVLVQDCFERLFFGRWMRVVNVGRQCGLGEVAFWLGSFLLTHAEDHCMLDVLHLLEVLVANAILALA